MVNMKKLNKFYIAIITLLIFPTVGISQNHDDCLDRASTTISMRSCLAKELNAYNEQLSVNYERLHKSLTSKDQENFKKTQKIWLQFREAECDFSAFSEQPGTIAPLIITSCYIDMTKERIKQLKAYINQNKN